MCRRLGAQFCKAVRDYYIACVYDKRSDKTTTEARAMVVVVVVREAYLQHKLPGRGYKTNWNRLLFNETLNGLKGIRPGHNGVTVVNEPDICLTVGLGVWPTRVEESSGFPGGHA